MADVDRTISIIFEGVDNLSSELRTMGSNVESFGSGMQDIGQPFADATEKVMLLNAAIVGIATAGIKVSADIEEANNRMKDSLGLTNEEAEKFGEIAETVYTSGFGDDLTASFDAVILAQKKFGDNADVDIGKVTEQAMKLQKVFDVDLDLSMGAVSNLMTQFGLTSEEAMNLITKGFQDGLDGSGDFLESINEYSTQFANGGADADQFFSVLESGFAEGMLGTDKAADMFKEFRVRIQDDSKTTTEALESIGIDPAAFEANMASGKMTAIEAFNIVQQKLNETENKSVQFNAAVGLMGTQFEDLGTKSALAINTTNTSLDDMQGKIDNLSPADFKQNMISALRTVTTEFGNMSTWDDAKDNISAVFGDIAASFGDALKDVDMSGLEDAVGEVWNKISDVFKDNDLDLTTVEGMRNAIQIIVDSMETVVTVTKGIVDLLSPVFTAIVEMTKNFNDVDSDLKEFIGVVLGLGTALTTLGGVVAAGGGVLGGLSTLAGMFGTGGVLSAGLTAVGLLLTGPAGLAVGLGLVGTAIAGYTMSKMNAENEAAIKAIDDATKAAKGLYDQIDILPTGSVPLEFFTLVEAGELEEAQKIIDEITAKTHIAKIKAEADYKEFKTFYDDLTSLPDEKLVELTAAANSGDINAFNTLLGGVPDEKITALQVAYMSADFDEVTRLLGNVPEEKRVEILTAIKQGDFDEVTRLLGELPKEQQVDITATADITEAKQEIEWFDNDGNRHTIEVKAESEGIDTVKEDIEAIPTEKMLEIQLQGDIDKEIAEIETSADTLQEAFKYTAEVQIAEAQASAQILEAAFDAAGESVVALSESSSSMFGNLLDGWNELSLIDQNEFMDILEDQTELQDKALQSQIDLNEAQVEYMNAKADALAKGDGLIKIDSTGLEPALEMILFEVLEKVQVRVNEESADFLLGI